MVDQQNEIHADILKTAAELQKETDEKRLQKRAGVPTTYPEGSYVLVEYPKTMGGGRGRPPNKLQTIRKGPMKVIANDKDAYDLLDLVSRTVETVHVSRMYPFLYDPKWVDPETVAIRDQGEFVVESIVDSLIDDMPKTKWQFKVRWAGYDESYDEWLEWNSLKNVEALHTYLRKNKLAKHIPKSNQLLEDKPVPRRKVQENQNALDNTSVDKRVDKRRNRSNKSSNSRKRARQGVA